MPALRLACVAALALATGAAPAAPPRGDAIAAAPRPPASSPPADLGRAIAEDAPLPLDYATATPDPPNPGRLIQGPMEAVLYGPHAGAAATEAIGLLAHRLDLTRDLALGDRVRLLVRAAPGRGAVLDYVELDGAAGPVRLYRRRSGAAFAVDDFAGEDGQGLDRLLLRTPLQVLRVTSGFGLRLHPLLGYSRLHRGVDFAAQPGTPVLAAGSGAVVEVRRLGDYGLMLRLDHGGGLQTLYAHLSAWAPGLKAGAVVRQGQVIGWTGATGLVTGPHLHFEVIENGRPVDPALARPPPTPLSPAERQAFEARKAGIEAELARAATRS
jgi:murein DD-endopeptidase MepM/ murein hydrolase activator NlpD